MRWIATKVDAFGYFYGDCLLPNAVLAA